MLLTQDGVILLMLASILTVESDSPVLLAVLPSPARRCFSLRRLMHSVQEASILVGRSVSSSQSSWICLGRLETSVFRRLKYLSVCMVLQLQMLFRWCFFRPLHPSRSKTFSR